MERSYGREASGEREIAVFLPWSFWYTREVARGCMSHRHLTRRWRVTFCVLPPEVEDLPPFPRLAGVIAHVPNRRMAARLARLGKPVVNTCGAMENPPFPSVLADDRKIGRMAAGHFLDRGFTCLAVCRMKQGASHRRRQEAFERALAAEGLSCRVHETTLPPRRRSFREWVVGHMRQFLAEAPRPLGVFACDDTLGFNLAQACREAGLRVPVDVAILGVNDDDMQAALADPPLSSIRLPLHKVGIEAARLLLRLIRGRTAPKKPILLPPVEIVTRQSSDLLAVSDPDVVKALHFIRQHVHEGIGVQELLRAVPVNRRTLEKRFQRLLGRSPLAEIRRLRVEHVKHLLIHTDLPLPEVAAACGFSSAVYMTMTFHKLTGQTPSAFRRNSRE